MKYIFYVSTLGYYIKFFGEAQCHWTVRSEQKDAVRVVDYTGNHIYLNKKIYLFGHEGAEEIEIPAGTYKYNFTCELSNLLAESVTTTHGSIAYKVEAIIESQWQPENEARVPFKVLRNDSFNDFPEMFNAMQQENEQTFCCFCCDNGSCSMTVSIPREVYAAGHSIPIKIKYDNQGSVDITPTKIELKRMITYACSSPTVDAKYEIETVVEENTEGIIKKGIKNIECSLHIPMTTATSNKQYCTIIKIEYHLHVTGVADLCHSDLVVIFPITIGRDRALSINYANNLHRDADEILPTAPSHDDVPDYDFR